jgi:hypothetical protein
MPKVAIYEDGDLGFWKDNIRRARETLDVLSESIPTFVKFGSNSYF